MKHTKISNSVIRRLPRYLRKLDELTEKGITRISSFKLGELLGLTPSQIRQDFSCFGEFGQQGYGYNVTSLRAQISNILGMHRGYNAILLGCGKIGKALLCNFDFSACGITVKCAFDIDPGLIGSVFNGVEVWSQDELAPYLNENQIDLAVLCVPQKVAKSVADILIENGIEAIWNFTNTDIIEPYSPVLVENVHFSDSLLFLSYQVSNEKR